MEWRAELERAVPAAAAGERAGASGERVYEYAIRPEDDFLLEAIIAVLTIRRAGPGAIVYDEFASLQVARAAVFAGASAYRTHGERYDTLTRQSKRRLAGAVTDGRVNWALLPPDGSADVAAGSPEVAARALRPGGLFFIPESAQLTPAEAVAFAAAFRRECTLAFRTRPERQDTFDVSLWRRK